MGSTPSAIGMYSRLPDLSACPKIPSQLWLLYAACDSARGEVRLAMAAARRCGCWGAWQCARAHAEGTGADRSLSSGTCDEAVEAGGCIAAGIRSVSVIWRPSRRKQES